MTETPIYEVEVRGRPRPKGSGTVITSKSTGKPFFKQPKVLKQWRDDLRAAIQAHPPSMHRDQPIRLQIVFLLPMPKSKIRKRGYAEDQFPTSMPDLNKLVRAIEDEFTAKLYGDDSHITRSSERKRYTIGEPGVRIRAFVDVLTPEERTLYGG